MSTRREACIYIDGVVVDTANLVAGAPGPVRSLHRIELQLGVRSVLHELQQCGVQVSEETLRDFLERDAHDESGRSAYLTIARRGRPPARPRWRWIESSGVQISDGIVTFSGVAIEHDPTV